MTFCVPEKFRVRAGPKATDERYGNNGAFILGLLHKQILFAIASDGEGWEHVSVSRKDRCPTWEEMCQAKDMFWGPEDCVIQFHPPKADYVNCHPFCLHLWRSTEHEQHRPPAIFVGPA